MSDRSHIDGVAEMLKTILEDYTEEITEAIEKEAEVLAKECCQKLKSEKTSYQVKSGEYNKGWTVKRNSRKGADGYISYKVHNKDHYQLTHLLEYGHVGKNQYGQWGYVNAKPHIIKVEDLAQKEFPKRVEEIIKRSKK